MTLGEKEGHLARQGFEPNNKAVFVVTTCRIYEKPRETRARRTSAEASVKSNCE